MVYVTQGTPERMIDAHRYTPSSMEREELHSSFPPLLPVSPLDSTNRIDLAQEKGI
jgi:hypothetical protein